MKLVLHLLIAWAMAFGLMLISVGVLGSFYNRTELLEITGGSGLTVYLLWAGILSSVVVIRYFWANFSK